MNWKQYNIAFPGNTVIQSLRESTKSADLLACPDILYQKLYGGVQEYRCVLKEIASDSDTCGSWVHFEKC